MSYIVTYTGKKLYFADPQVDQIDIRDIVIGLSREGRFANQTTSPYRVAQHSCFVAGLVAPPLRLEALLHDATEAYMRDLASPLKQLVPEYKVLEKRLDAVIRLKFNIAPVHSPEVKRADEVALVTEMRDFLPRADYAYLFSARPYEHRLAIWSEATCIKCFSEELENEGVKF